MDKRVSHVPLGRDAENSPGDRGVVDLARCARENSLAGAADYRIADARARRDSLAAGPGSVHRSKSSTRLTDFQCAQSCCLFWHSRVVLFQSALEQQGHYRDSLAAVSMYETPESRTKLDNQTISYLRVQIGLGYNYNGDHPKAIAMLKATLRDYAESGGVKPGPYLCSAVARLSNDQRVSDCA